ncbi:MAG TPA: hypothetical protein VJU86_02750 [Pyrinomonadaceae bacterium]|nr:hypothetical protein [Pyrinomonadaceae bacterium]
MNNVVNLDQFKARHRRKEIDHDLTLFLVGIFLTMVAPTAVYLAFRGPVPFAAFALTAFTGIILGLTNYFYFPYQVISCIEKDATRSRSARNTTTPPTTGANEKKAA